MSHLTESWAYISPFLMSDSTELWSIDSFLSKVTTSIDGWAAIITTMIGLAMLIMSIFRIAKKLMGRSSNDSWALCVALFFFGGVFATGGGWLMAGKLASMGRNTLVQMGSVWVKPGTSSTTEVTTDASATIVINDNVVINWLDAPEICIK